MSFLFPNLATARASKALCVFEYNPGGLGLNMDTLWESYEGYRVIWYFAVMAFALLTHSTMGLIIMSYRDRL